MLQQRVYLSDLMGQLIVPGLVTQSPYSPQTAGLPGKPWAETLGSSRQMASFTPAFATPMASAPQC